MCAAGVGVEIWHISLSERGSSSIWGATIIYYATDIASLGMLGRGIAKQNVSYRITRVLENFGGFGLLSWLNICQLLY